VIIYLSRPDIVYSSIDFIYARNVGRIIKTVFKELTLKHDK